MIIIILFYYRWTQHYIDTWQRYWSSELTNQAILGKYTILSICQPHDISIFYLHDSLYQKINHRHFQCLIEKSLKQIQIQYSHTHTHDCLSFYLDTGTSLKHGRFKLVSLSNPNLLVK